MLLTTESTAWAVSCSAGASAGLILGHGVTVSTIASVALIATIAVGVCGRLLRAIHADFS